MKPDGFKRAGPFARVLRVEPTFQMPLAAPAGFVRKWSRDGRGSNFVDFCRFTILLIQTRSIFPSADVFLFRKMMITLRHWNCFPIFSQAHLYIETDLCWANLCPSVGRRLHRHRAGRALDHAKEGIVGCLGKPVFFLWNLGADPPDIQINCYYWRWFTIGILKVSVYVVYIYIILYNDVRNSVHGHGSSVPSARPSLSWMKPGIIWKALTFSMSSGGSQSRFVLSRRSMCRRW
jgi:hypothetical protein